MLLLGILLSIPACIARRLRADDRGPDRRPDRGRDLGRHGVPDDAGPDRRPVDGAGADAVDRAVVGARRRDRRARAARVGLPARAVRVGLGLPRDAAAGRSSRCSWRGATSRATSTRRPSRSTTSAASCRPWSSDRSILGDQLRAGPDEGRLALACSPSRRSARSRSCSRQQRTPNPLYDLQIAGRRIFWVAAWPGSSSSAR